MFHTPSDAELWDAIKQGDAKSFEVLFERYWAPVFTTAFSYCKDREACADIVHDLFLTLWQKRGQLQIDSFPSYLKAAARYHIFRHLRTAKVKPLEYTENISPFASGLVAHHGEEQMLYLELETKVESYLESLPKRCREIFLLSRKEHLSNDEIALRLQISKRSVENQLTHALQHLKLSMKDLVTMLILWTLTGK